MSLLKLSIAKTAIEFLSKLPPKQHKQIQSAIYKLMNDPEPHNSIPMAGNEFKGIWRNKVGEYRIIYTFDTDEITIIEIGNRNDSDVYKRAKRKL